jgi:preprotein translocase subunit SecF
VEYFRTRQWDIIGKTKLWFSITGFFILAGLIALGVRGLNLGIDFTGGSLHRYSFEQPLAQSESEVPATLAKIRSMLAEVGLESSQLQIVGDQQGALTSLYLRAPAVANDEEAAKRDKQIVAGLRKLFPDKGQIQDLGRETVGPVVGRDLQNNAILALVLGWALILIYITVRYEFRFAVAGVAGLVHDAFFTIGIMALLHVELDSSFVAAILTILGYSINDAVIIFDRIRENMRLRRRAIFAETVNSSLLQTMARSINTTLTTLLPLIALYFLGGQSIASFSLALLFGITVGAYSSIFISSPIVVLWEGKAARERAQAVAAARGRTVRSAAGNGGSDVSDAPHDSGASKVSQDSVIARLKQEEQAERSREVDEETAQKREERREKRAKEKARKSKKRRF